MSHELENIVAILIVFLFFFGMAMFGFYVHFDSFAAIKGLHFLTSCLIGIAGIVFTALFV